MAPRTENDPQPRAPHRRLLGLSLTVAIAACNGSDDVATSAGATSSGEAPATGSTTGDEGAASSTGGGETSTSGGDAPFELERENIRLLPFAVRLSRLTRLLDRPAEDPMFAQMNARRFELGDYDFSQNINPDLNWSSTRMSHWVAALRPICSSPTMKQRYPEFPLDLPELMHDAYGYPPSSAELEPYAALFDQAETGEEDGENDSIGGEQSPASALTDEVRYETACIAVLSSLEFVSQ